MRANGSAECQFYQVLGVDRAASSGDIRAAYIRLVRQHHPDAGGRLPGRLHLVQQAYRCLSDPELRARHDALIADNERAYRSRQRSAQKRLDRYDRRKVPQRPPQQRGAAVRSRAIRPQGRRLRSIFLMAVGAALLFQLSLYLPV